LVLASTGLGFLSIHFEQECRSLLVLGSTHFPGKWSLIILSQSVVKRPERETDYSAIFNVEIKKVWSLVLRSCTTSGWGA